MWVRPGRWRPSPLGDPTQDEPRTFGTPLGPPRNPSRNSGIAGGQAGLHHPIHLEPDGSGGFGWGCGGANSPQGLGRTGPRCCPWEETLGPQRGSWCRGRGARSRPGSDPSHRRTLVCPFCRDGPRWRRRTHGNTRVELLRNRRQHEDDQPLTGGSTWDPPPRWRLGPQGPFSPDGSSPHLHTEPGSWTTRPCAIRWGKRHQAWPWTRT